MRRLPPISLALITMALTTACGSPARFTPGAAPIKVGVLHSRTGTMSLSENTVAEAELLAIEQINRRGGIVVNGQHRRLVAIEEDGASEPKTFAAKAAQLIDRDQVAVVFGGWTSSSRKAMAPVFEQRNTLLFYPVQFEGLECSRNIVYGGSTPNQQAEPAIEWLLSNKNTRYFLLGSDYVYPRSANQQIRAQLQGRAQIAGEHYVRLGDGNLEPVLDLIQRALPKGGVIINTLNGDSNVAFFKGLATRNMDRRHNVRVMSFSVSEEEVAAIGPKTMRGTYAAWSFFHSLPTAAAKRFNRDFQNTYGPHRVTNDPAEAAYSLVMLWAQAVQRAGSLQTDRVRQALIGLRYAAPQGEVTVEPNLHLRKRSLIGEVQPNGEFRILRDFGVIKPLPWGSRPAGAATTVPRCDWRDPRPNNQAPQT